jgi:hypothetical protein
VATGWAGVSFADWRRLQILLYAEYLSTFNKGSIRRPRAVGNGSHRRYAGRAQPVWVMNPGRSALDAMASWRMESSPWASVVSGVSSAHFRDATPPLKTDQIPSSHG